MFNLIVLDCIYMGDLWRTAWNEEAVWEKKLNAMSWIRSRLSRK